MKEELIEYACLLGKDRPDVLDILQRAELFPHDLERFVRLLKNQWLEEGGNVLNKPSYGKYTGIYPPDPESYLVHKLGVATTGFGKSMTAFLEGCSLIEKQVQVILFDYQNQFTDLGMLYPDVYVAWPDMLKLNLLERYGNASAEEVAGEFGANARENLYFRDMSESVCFEEILKAKAKYGDHATIYHLIRELNTLVKRINVRERTHGAIVTILNRLNRLVNELPKTFSCSNKGFPIEFFQSKSIVFPLQGVSIYIANFLVNHILGLVMRNRKPSDRLETLIIIDEAQNYTSRQREMRMDLGEVFINSALRMSRKFGIGFYLLSQTMSTFSPAILANTNTVFVGRMLNGPCVRAAALRLGLNDEQAEALGSLPNRNFVVQSVECPEPSLLEIPYIERKKFDPREVEAVTKERLAAVPFTPFDKREIESTAPKKIVQKQENLPKDLVEIMKNIHDKPDLSFDARCKELGTTYETLIKKVSYLQEKGWVGKFQSLGLGGRGKPRKGLSLTKEGLVAIGAQEPEGKGSLRHRVIVKALKERFGGILEYNGADLFIAEGGTGTAVEVELDVKGEHWLENVRRDLEFSDRVVVVAADEPGLRVLKARAKERLEEDILGRIEIRTIGDVLKNGTL